VGGQHRYLAVASVFIAFHIAAVVMGLHFYWHEHSHDPSRNWLMPTAILINLGILVTVLVYFRSSYERLRDFAAEPWQTRRAVRLRLRIRLRLYAILVLVGLVTSLWLWPVGYLAVSLLNAAGWVGHVQFYWTPALLPVWVIVVPLVASRAVMHELLGGRLTPEHELTSADRAALSRSSASAMITDWETTRLRVIPSSGLNAPSMGRNKNIAVTSDAISDEQTLRGALSHELGHHRLHHLRPLALSYLYLWPYMWFDEDLARLSDLRDDGRVTALAHRVVRAGWTVLALPGWIAWCLLRWLWRTAEYDADRFACQSEHGSALEAALRRHDASHKEQRPARWQDRVRKGWDRVGERRALGYLPIPNEHPSPERRIRKLRRWEWSRAQPHGVAHPDPATIAPETRS
jgi:Zn-dependent protease with chaperone function